MLNTRDGVIIGRTYDLYCVNGSGLSINLKAIKLVDYEMKLDGFYVTFEFTRKQDVKRNEMTSFTFDLNILKNSPKQFFLIEKIKDKTHSFELA